VLQSAQALLAWNSTSREICAIGKTFVIDHPLAADKHLVHACLEGPEIGVYYRGKGIIPDNGDEYVEISLPRYTKCLATNFSIQLTAINTKNIFYTTSEVNEDTGTFKVFGKPGAFFWHVYGSRGDIEVEPLKASVNVKGDGPYKWI